MKNYGYPPPPPPPIPPHSHKCTKEEVLNKLDEAVKEAEEKAESARKYSASVYQKLSSIILDPSGSYGQSQMREMIEKTGKSTLIEAIVSLCDMMETGAGVTITYDAVVEALGYVPAAEAGANYVVGYFLEDEETDDNEEETE